MARSQSRDDVELTAAGLRDQVARARAGLVDAGVSQGDRVAAYSPNIPETLVLLLAAASLGAVFSSCAPEFGTQSVIDRWQQIEPTVARHLIDLDRQQQRQQRQIADNRPRISERADEEESCRSRRG